MEYIESFLVDQQEEIKIFLAKNGFVVIKNAISKDQAKKTIKGIGDLMTAKEPTFDIFDIKTYDKAPVSSNYGIFDPSKSKEVESNLVAENVIKAYSLWNKRY